MLLCLTRQSHTPEGTRITRDAEAAAVCLLCSSCPDPYRPLVASGVSGCRLIDSQERAGEAIGLPKLRVYTCGRMLQVLILHHHMHATDVCLVNCAVAARDAGLVPCL